MRVPKYLPFGNTGYVNTQTGRVKSMLPGTSHFRPADQAEHERCNAGEPGYDYCLNCGRPFMAHTNGRCPE